MRKALIWLLVIFIPLLAATGLYLHSQLFTPLAPPDQVQYRVSPGASLSLVADDLANAGVLRTAAALKFFARLDDLSGQVQQGNYSFSKPATPQQILQRLTAGDVDQVSLTIPEGFTLAQIAQRIDNQGYGQQNIFMQLATDPKFIQSLQLRANSLEGYLFPETYLFTPGIDEAAILQMLVKQFQRQVGPQLLAQAKKQHLNLHQLVTLASIIEKETAKVEEMPLISSVFHNRLRRGIQLQTDPTVIYGIKDFDGNLTRKHLTTPTPYNTYVIRGLPPGPIANPGLAALQAAATPAESKYLYFVARGDGSHHFSRSLKEHNQAVRKFQLRRKN